MAKAPFKMKYTNGKKADATAFPFLGGVVNAVGGATKSMKGGKGVGGPRDMIAAKVDEKVEEKVNKVVNQETEEGLV